MLTYSYYAGKMTTACVFNRNGTEQTEIMKFYRHGVVIRIFPSGHISDTRSSVVAISQSASSFSFSMTVINRCNEFVKKKMQQN